MKYSQKEIVKHAPITQKVMTKLNELEDERAALLATIDQRKEVVNDEVKRVGQIDGLSRALTPVVYWLAQAELIDPNALK